MIYDIDTATDFFKTLADCRLHTSCTSSNASELNFEGYEQPSTSTSDEWDSESIVLLLQSLRYPSLLANPLSIFFPVADLTLREKQTLLASNKDELHAILKLEGWTIATDDNYKQ